MTTIRMFNPASDANAGFIGTVFMGGVLYLGASRGAAGETICGIILAFAVLMGGYALYFCSWLSKQLALTHIAVERISKKNFNAQKMRDVLFVQVLQAIVRRRKLNPAGHNGPIVEAFSADLMGMAGRISLAGSVCITLGLIGTVLGMIAVFDDVGLAIQSKGDLSAITAAMSDCIGSLGEAFVTTLFGSFGGGLLLKVIGGTAFRGVDKLMAEIEAQLELIDDQRLIEGEFS